MTYGENLREIHFKLMKQNIGISINVQYKRQMVNIVLFLKSNTMCHTRPTLLFFSYDYAQHTVLYCKKLKDIINKLGLFILFFLHFSHIF